MTTATKSKAPSAAESWSAWLEQLDQLQEERAEITGLGEAREALTRAKNGARYAIGLANHNRLYPGGFYHDPDEDETAALLEVMNRIHGAMSRAREAANWHSRSPDHQRYIIELSGRAQRAASELEQAAEQAQALEEARGEVDQRLEALEAKAPKASASSLDALRKERDAAATERDRIGRALDNMTADDSPLALAREAEQAAQDRLDEAEALLAMGEAQTSEVKTAKTEAEKARRALEEQQTEHRRQEAARRGLARKLEQVESRLETLERAYRQALGRVRHAELAAAESALVDHLKAASEHLANISRIYADLEEAEPGASYGRAAIEAKLPTLHHHPRSDEIRHGLTITAHGVEE